MPRIKFFAIDVLSSLLTVAIWVGVGYVGGHTLQIIKQDIVRIEHITVFFIASIVIYLFFRRIFWSRKY